MSVLKLGRVNALSVNPHVETRKYVVVLDCSGSMEGYDATVNQLADIIGGADAIVLFSTSMLDNVKPKDYAKLIREIGFRKATKKIYMNSFNGTLLYKTLRYVTEYTHAGMDVLLVTDGADIDGIYRTPEWNVNAMNDAIQAYNQRVGRYVLFVGNSSPATIGHAFIHDPYGTGGAPATFVADPYHPNEGVGENIADSMGIGITPVVITGVVARAYPNGPILTLARPGQLVLIEGYNDGAGAGEGNTNSVVHEIIFRSNTEEAYNAINEWIETAYHNAIRTAPQKDMLTILRHILALAKEFRSQIHTDDLTNVAATAGRHSEFIRRWTKKIREMEVKTEHTSAVEREIQRIVAAGKRLDQMTEAERAALLALSSKTTSKSQKIADRLVNTRGVNTTEASQLMQIFVGALRDLGDYPAVIEEPSMIYQFGMTEIGRDQPLLSILADVVNAGGFVGLREILTEGLLVGRTLMLNRIPEGAVANGFLLTVDDIPMITAIADSAILWRDQHIAQLGTRERFNAILPLFEIPEEPAAQKAVMTLLRTQMLRSILPIYGMHFGAVAGDQIVKVPMALDGLLVAYLEYTLGIESFPNEVIQLSEAEHTRMKRAVTMLWLLNEEFIINMLMDPRHHVVPLMTATVRGHDNIPNLRAQALWFPDIIARTFHMLPEWVQHRFECRLLQILHMQDLLENAQHAIRVEALRRALTPTDENSVFNVDGVHMTINGTWAIPDDIYDVVAFDRALNDYVENVRTHVHVDEHDDTKLRVDTLPQELTVRIFHQRIPYTVEEVAEAMLLPYGATERLEAAAVSTDQIVAQVQKCRNQVLNRLHNSAIQQHKENMERLGNEEMHRRTMIWHAHDWATPLTEEVFMNIMQTNPVLRDYITARMQMLGHGSLWSAAQHIFNIGANGLPSNVCVTRDCPVSIYGERFEQHTRQGFAGQHRYFENAYNIPGFHLAVQRAVDNGDITTEAFERNPTEVIEQIWTAIRNRHYFREFPVPGTHTPDRWPEHLYGDANDGGMGPANGPTMAEEIRHNLYLLIAAYLSYSS